jgi:hypothetical protein
MGKVIDITSQLKRPSDHSKLEVRVTEVVDMAKRREEILDSERRKVKRTILTEFIGSFIVVPQKGLHKVSIYDISDSGIAFDLPEEIGQLIKNEEVAMRVYMNKQTYFPFVVTVSNCRFIEEEGVYRHGASFLKGTINDVALHHFVKFIENISASLRQDNGDVMVSNLGR